jgi:hypothetical protein
MKGRGGTPRRLSNMGLFGFESKLALTNKIGLNNFQVIGLFG